MDTLNNPAQNTLNNAPQNQSPAKKPIFKRVWFWLAIIAVIIIATVVSRDGETPAPADGASGASAAADGAAEDQAAEPQEPQGPTADFGLGQPAADGDFSFVVSGVDCSLTRIGNEHFGTDAQGQFCVVSVAVTNIGDAAQSFFGDNAVLFNAQGQEFSADTEAAIYLEDSSSIFEEINPGNTLNSKVVFDVPAGTAPTAIELHDSAFSGGVTVSLQ